MASPCGNAKGLRLYYASWNTTLQSLLGNGDLLHTPIRPQASATAEVAQLLVWNQAMQG